RSGVHSEVPRPGESGPLAPHEVKRRALAQRLAHKMPTYPALAIDPSVTPSVPVVAHVPSRPSAPVASPPPSAPNAASASSAAMPPSPPRVVSAPAHPPPITARYNDPPKPP